MLNGQWTLRVWKEMAHLTLGKPHLANVPTGDSYERQKAAKEQFACRGGDTASAHCHLCLFDQVLTTTHTQKLRGRERAGFMEKKVLSFILCVKNICKKYNPVREVLIRSHIKIVHTQTHNKPDPACNKTSSGQDLHVWRWEIWDSDIFALIFFNDQSQGVYNKNSASLEMHSMVFSFNNLMNLF